MHQEAEDLVPRLSRTTLCLASSERGNTVHHGEHGFPEMLQQHYSPAESDALEQLVHLKRKLIHSSKADFWRVLVQDMTAMTAAQYGFVSKRIHADEGSATEMPSIDEPGSCLLAVVLYWNDGGKLHDLARDYKYWASGAPCGGMKHNKVFLVPSDLSKFFPDNPNMLPFPAEAYIGIPLFSGEKCFGHFGMMWNDQGLQKLSLSWAYVEALLHSLEDIVLDRLLQSGKADDSIANAIEPVAEASEMAKAKHSLKPFAPNLSHELRTPMQGIVGMLDVMHASVQESLEGSDDTSVRRLLNSLRENIEVVQDSSRRAVEAADNVVHAYALDMQVPETPSAQGDNDYSEEKRRLTSGGRQDYFNFPEKSIAGWRGAKKRRIGDAIDKDNDNLTGHATSFRRNSAPNRTFLETNISAVDRVTVNPELPVNTPGPGSLPSTRQARIRELLHLLVNQSLCVGGRPESALLQEREGGETINVSTRTADGRLSSKLIDWSVDANVPEVITVDEKDLAKLISCVFLNAVKFTEEGIITLTTSLSPNANHILIKVNDTGPGIPHDFLPFLFKPFSREDDSLTRQKEGLGLGLLVAKGLARKIGGDLVCTRSEVDGPKRGSEFELRIPLSPAAGDSRTSTPSTRSVPGHGVQSEPPSRRESTLGWQRLSQATHASPSNAQSKSIFPTPLYQKPPLADTRAQPSPCPSTRQAPSFDRGLARKHPLTFLVAEDNALNRRLLTSMLGKLGYTNVYEAYDGEQAVNQMAIDRTTKGQSPIDVVLMDLWMPNMDGYEAARRIFAMQKTVRLETDATEDSDSLPSNKVTIIAVTADATDSALERARQTGMAGYLTKPYVLLDLERKILEHCIGTGETI